MPTQFALKCPTDADLNKAIFAIEEEMGDNFKEISGLIDSLSLPTDDMDSALKVMDQIISLGGDTLDNLSDRTGMPKNTPTRLEDEKRFSLTGLAIVNGTPWKMDSSNNIEAVRELYFALGSDKNKLLEILGRESNDFVLINSKVNTVTLPAKKNGIKYTVDEIRTLLNNNSIQEDDIVQLDSTIVVKTYAHVSTDASIKTAAILAGVTEDEIVSTVFHMGEIQNNAKTLNRYATYGITGIRQQAALFGEDAETYAQSEIESLVASGQQKLNRVMKLLDLIIQRFSAMPPEVLNKTAGDALVALDAAHSDINSAESLVNFRVVLIPDKSVYTKMLEKNTQADFFDVLDNRTDITGLDFAATEDEINTLINNAMAIRAGTSTISAIQVNQISDKSQTSNNIYKIESDIDYINKSLSEKITLINLQNSRKAAEEAQYVVAYTAIAAAPAQPYIGQVSYDSPASIAGRRLNFNNAFGLDKKFDKLLGMLNPLTDIGKATLAQLSAAIVKMIEGIIRIANSARLKADQLIAGIRKKIAPWQAKFEALQSKYGSLTGQGSFDSSLIKCAIGFDVSLASGLFQILEELIRRLETLINNIINGILEIISKLLEKILCYPIVLLDNLLNKINSALPTFCKVFNITLPDDLEKALQELRNALGGYGTVFGPLNGNLLSANAAVTNNLSKLQDFKQSMTCATSATNRFFSTSLFSAGASIPL